MQRPACASQVASVRLAAEQPCRACWSADSVELAALVTLKTSSGSAPVIGNANADGLLI